MAAGWWDGLLPDYGDASDPAVRARYGYLEGWVGILGNAGLFAGKLLLGLLIGSIALVADAFHSLSDVATSGVVVLGFRYAKKPADEHHPYGHGRVEHIATLVIAVLLAIAGVELVMQSVERLSDPPGLMHEELVLLVAAIVLASAAAKEAMARYSSAISRRIGSDVLEADAWHHRSDAVSSVAVALSLVGTHYGLTHLDPVFGIVVAVIIVYVAVRLVRTSSSSLIGEAPDEGLVEEVTRVAKGVDGVEGVHDIEVHDYGTQKVITLHAEVARGLSADEAHAIADSLDSRLVEVTSHPTIIHVDPEGSEARDEVWRTSLEALLEMEPGVISFHRVKFMRREGREELTMHLIVDADMSVEDSHQLSHRLEAGLRERCGDCSVIVHFEPCVKDCEACRINCTVKEGRCPEGQAR